jgi:hypothetical protein
MYHTGGFVAVDSVNQLIVVSFQGTDSRVGNKVANDNSLEQQVSLARYCDGCLGSRGYVEAFDEVRDKVVDAVNAARLANPTYQVVTTGHSLGGALSTIAALELRKFGIPTVAVSLAPFNIQHF